jgi:hypothetical protein
MIFDISETLSRLNTSLQGSNADTFSFLRLIKKMRLCKAFESGNIGTIVNISTSKKNDEFEETKPQVLPHLINHYTNSKTSFSDEGLSQHEWIRNTLAVSRREDKLPSCRIPGIHDGSCDTSLKIKFEALSLLNFW